MKGLVGDMDRSVLSGGRYLGVSALILLLAGTAALMLPHAAMAAAVTPGAGSILQQVNPKKPPVPSGAKTGLKLKRPKQRISKSKTPIFVKRIVITGNTLFPTATLHALIAGAEGKQQTLGDLDRLAGRITDYYQTHGYSLSRAVIPAQTIKGGVIRFEVLEARYDRVSVHNHSRVIGRLLRATLSPLKHGHIISDRKQDRALLLFSDIPGVSFDADLKPGSMVGTSDLIVDAKSKPMFSGYLSVDNYGNQYTGRARGGMGLIIDNPLHLGDELKLDGLITGTDLEYGRAAYDVVLNGTGLRLGASYSALHYILAGALANLRGYGTARILSGWLKQPIIRQQHLNLYAQVAYDYQRLRDHLDTAAIRTDRELADGRATLNGDERDGILAGGISSWDVTWTGGRVVFRNPLAQAADAATAKTGKYFYKVEGDVVRLQELGRKFSLYLLASGQWTIYNLDPSEKMVVGGPNDVRAYDVGVLSADTGYRGTAELRRSFPDGFQAKVFFDGERVTIDHHPWVAGTNTATLEGVGFGLDWDGPMQTHLQGVVAVPVGAKPALLASRSTVRGWVQMTKVF